MNAVRLLLAVGVCFVLTSCATVPTATKPAPTSATQELLLQTDPPGAACSILQRGEIVASVEATPAIATVRRDGCTTKSDDSSCTIVGAIPPIEVVCRKEGFLESRETFPSADAWLVTTDQALQGVKMMGTVVLAGALMLGGPTIPAAVAAAPSLMLPVAGAGAAGAAVVAAGKDAAPSPYYGWAYFPLPKFFLVPAAFDTASARDAFFVTLKSKLEASAATQLAQSNLCVRLNCKCDESWRCDPSECPPVPTPVCNVERARIDAQLRSRLERMSAQCAEVRVDAP